MTLAFECLPVYSIGRHFRGRGRVLEVPTPLEFTNQHLDLTTTLATPGWGSAMLEGAHAPEVFPGGKEQCGSTQPRRECLCEATQEGARRQGSPGPREKQLSPPKWVGSSGGHVARSLFGKPSSLSCTASPRLPCLHFHSSSSH